MCIEARRTPHSDLRWSSEELWTVILVFLASLRFPEKGQQTVSNVWAVPPSLFKSWPLGEEYLPPSGGGMLLVLLFQRFFVLASIAPLSIVSGLNSRNIPYASKSP